MPVSELLKFAANVRVLPVPLTQDLAPSQLIKSLAVRITLRNEDGRLTYPQFERFLKQLAETCFRTSSEGSRVQALIAHMKQGCAAAYNVALAKDRRYRSSDKVNDSSSLSISVRNSFGHDFGQTAEAFRQKRNSDASLVKARPGLQMQTIPGLTKKLSLTGLGSKAGELRHIYEQPRAFRRTPSAAVDIRPALLSPKSSTRFLSTATEESRSPKSPTPARISVRWHNRHESLPNDVLGLMRKSVERLQTKMVELKSTKRVRGLTHRGELFVHSLHSRRVRPVSVIQRTVLLLALRTWRLHTLLLVV